MPFRNLDFDIRAKISISAYKIDEKDNTIPINYIDIENSSNVKDTKIK